MSVEWRCSIVPAHLHTPVVVGDVWWDSPVEGEGCHPLGLDGAIHTLIPHLAVGPLAMLSVTWLSSLLVLSPSSLPAALSACSLSILGCPPR